MAEYRRVSVAGVEAIKEALRVEMPPPSGERIVAASWVDAAGEEHVVRFEPRGDGLQPLVWHYGPTVEEPDPGRMWHYRCGGEVMVIDGGRVCMRCSEQETSGDE